LQDDATGKLLAAGFFPAETTHAYFCLLRHVLRRYGLPVALYGDRHSIFVRNDDHWPLEEQLRGRQQPTQFGRALEQLGITYIAAHSPQAKGRIERLWGVFQDRLRSELRRAQAADLPAANQLLRRFLPDYNRRFAHPARERDQAWRPAPKDLNRICCFVHERIVSNDNVVQWDGRRFQIPPQPHRFSFAGARVQLYETLEGRLSIYYKATPLRFAEGGHFHSAIGVTFSRCYNTAQTATLCLFLLVLFNIAKKLFCNLVRYVRTGTPEFRTLAFLGGCPDHVSIR
jgi:hypothetical protein